MSDDGYDLLQDILATGRARWLEVTRPRAVAGAAPRGQDFLGRRKRR